ncbi:ANTAR domain-containing response regulator [Evansella sp. AB-rgal1]|uniref:ANTAR domain-containing response regulator n=1 Tax=Evansella sp. AB-rgal1 TaxID=3242696 RepID=UPI00359E10A1
MIDSFLLFFDSKLREYYKPTDPSNLGSRLQDLGYRVMKTSDSTTVSSFIDQVDALIVCSTVANIERLGKTFLTYRSLPFIWWAHSDPHGDTRCQLEIDIDSMLSSTMTDSELHWALHLCSNRYLQRIQWEKERELLLNKLEERKHIEKAKSILCELHQFSEAEAYEFLRKQAMDERKRIVDVAISIVSVYPLLMVNKGAGNS